MERVPSLPLPLFSSIVAFAVDDYSNEILPEKRRLHLASNNLRNLGLISKLWLASIRELVAQFQLSTLTLKFETASRSELLEMRQKVGTRGRQVTDLRVSMGKVASFGEYFHRNRQLPETLNILELGWDALIAPLTGLRRLDLSEMPFSSPHTQKVLEAAAKYCRDLEALVLPGKEHYQLAPPFRDVEPLMNALYNAMERWKPAGHRRGLRQLKIPTINEAERFRSCREFFDNVVKFCPQVEYLDGYKHSLCEMDRLTCQDLWLLNLDDWKKFNAACTNLREFNWVVAPFADPYFQVFGEHVKPRLKKLVFCANLLWDWGQYFYELDKEAGLMARTNIVPVDRAGYGWAAKDPSTALIGCPSLEELEIALYHRDADEEFDLFTRNRDNLPNEEMFQQSIFNDHFCETLAANCPLISRIALWEVVEGPELQHIHTFTDRGLVALSRLKYLDFMELRSINCTGNGLFEFLNGFSNEFTGQRTFQISVGGKSILPEYERTDRDFYTAVMSLLTRIANTPVGELPVCQERIVLRLKNAVASSVEEDWSEDYLEHLKEVVSRVKETHLSLRLRVTAFGYNGKSFRSIAELGLYAAHAEPSIWFGWDEEENNRDVVFVNRGGRPYQDSAEDVSREDDSDYEMDAGDSDSDVDFAL